MEWKGGLHSHWTWGLGGRAVLTPNEHGDGGKGGSSVPLDVGTQGKGVDAHPEERPPSVDGRPCCRHPSASASR